MESGGGLAALFLACCGLMARASPVSVPGCTLEPVRNDQRVKVFYTTSRVTSGCVGRGPTDPNLEIHVLNLRYRDPVKPREIKFNVNVTAAKEKRKTVFVVNSNAFSVLDVNAEDHHLAFLTTKHILFIKGPNKENTTDLPLSSEELLNWAKAYYGGVTSFTELEDSQKIQFQVGREPNSFEECIPESNFNAEQYLEAEFASDNTKSCLGSTEHPGREAHIMWLQQNPPDSGTQAVDLNIKVTCSDGNPANELSTLLVLKSHEKMLWNIDQTPVLVKFLVSGKYSLKKVASNLINGIALPDSKDGLIQEALGKDFAFIASYTEIPSAKSITLELVRVCGKKTEVTTPPQRKVPELTNMVKELIRLCHPWRCIDNSIEIAVPKSHLQASPSPITEITLRDPTCRATDNMTHFVLKSIVDHCSTQLEGGIHAKNQLVLTLPLLPDKVTVPFECDLPEKLFLHLYQTPDFRSASTTTVEVNKVTYVQVSFQIAEENHPLPLQDCFLQIPGQTSPQMLIHSGIPTSYSVEILNSPSIKTRHFSFIYKAEEQWSTLPATLVCQVHLETQLHGHRSYEGSTEVTLKNPTFPSHSLRIGTVLGITFGAFLIGVMLTAALWYIYSHTRLTVKMQPVSANPPASESSSTNHSIGSTQSTPCSTGSMA
ncbi:endoglin isoform X2 [Rhineura floridana]|uniref:endoglin isoform X2 n=1 Tax=Rhineura floridana TaxID=261503 RepID=UPI002AC88680|nr:endoglin isoform X2 [Rhineura floridana]